ncbi:hypothetical protein IEQ34_019001 [Dendrobium chrysotoxum]|uniref:Cyclin-dependent kinase inhibitor domain-containing protein n=1 Tax=Dendrobium chrysotoxum TaxID=161865 RepID=A0AAV7G7J6_DENCH|nr:hypothetical protein IEQ34_019001 [Dendrobium chrysotoxum]
MGRYMRKCRRIAEVTVMEVTQVVGVRTRARTLALAAAATVPEEAAIGGVSPKRRKATEETTEARSGAGELEMAYLQLRNRSLVMTKRLSKSARNSDAKRRGSAERGRISRCSSIASCEGVEEDDAFRYTSSGGQKPRGDLGSSVCYFECNRDRCEITPSSNQVIYSGEVESTAERESRMQSTPQLRMPSAAELEEFFAAVEKSEKQQFAARYNFDVDNEIPLEGRYEWVRINQ